MLVFLGWRVVKMSLYLLDAWVAGSCSEIEDPIAFSDLGEIIFKCYPDVVVWFLWAQPNPSPRPDKCAR